MLKFGHKNKDLQFIQQKHHPLAWEVNFGGIKIKMYELNISYVTYDLWELIFYLSDGGRCPDTHPFAYNEGKDCCAAPFEDMNDALGRACDGSPIGLESRCCLNAYKVKNH